MSEKLPSQTNSMSPQLSHKGKAVYLIKRTLLCAGIVYFSVLVFLVTFENRMVFPASKYPRGNWQPTEFKFEEVSYAAADGTKLVGWFLKNPHPATGDCETAIVFHGNAENAAQAARMGVPLSHFGNLNVLLAEFRGYGKSEGSANQAGVLLDAEAAMDWVCQRMNKSPQEIILFGHSMGGGPACYLANKLGCKALILDRTYNNLPDVAGRNFPAFPVKWLMQNQFPSEQWISEFFGPVLVTHGDTDTLIPLELGQKLFDSAPSSKKQLKIYPNWGHWDPFPDEYWQNVARFIEHDGEGNHP